MSPSRLFASLWRLLRLRRPRPRREPLDLDFRPQPPSGAPAADAEPAPAPLPHETFAPLPDDAACVEVEESEDAFEEEELAADVDAELDLRPDLDVIVAERHARLDDTRREAERRALAGEQRVRLTDAAGPGTLAETLARLEREGRVSSRLEEDEGSPVLVYTPVEIAQAASGDAAGNVALH